MAKFVPDATLDLFLGVIRDNADRQDVCSTQPTTYAEATSTYSLADVTMTTGTDYTQANGDTSGRKITVAQKTGVTIDTAGSAQHLALTNGSDTLYAVTTCSTVALTTPGTLTINAWDIEISDVS
jgi:hypothetical protein